MKSLRIRKVSLGEKIKVVRKSRKLSLRKLAAIADMEHSHINLIEKGEVSPSIAVMEVLAEALDISLTDLYSVGLATLTDIENDIIRISKEKRVQLKITQSELSEKLGATKEFVSDIENGQLGICYGIRHLEAMARVFKCNLTDLLP
ncbi:helix-turn-helix domain-containing protein [Chitinophaga sedimenti]|uniref:helix-turn-helix domain-containing protein n=1 Tax=Chitinophaga sedimenti TaxID=2033606 RepID=UPI002005E9C5|nr:helix-turn-helix transcriptional regulator [Chitinophaga sedimenti]MCK7557566.1 helix-turn-helix domain-containing protein [Chitinophaga sedimenti]